MTAENVEIVKQAMAVYEAYNVYTLRDGKVTRIEFFTTKEPALRAAGLGETQRKVEEVQ
jgi:hypothetical protein